MCGAHTAPLEREPFSCIPYKHLTLEGASRCFGHFVHRVETCGLESSRLCRPPRGKAPLIGSCCHPPVSRLMPLSRPERSPNGWCDRYRSLASRCGRKSLSMFELRAITGGVAAGKGVSARSENAEHSRRAGGEAGSDRAIPDRPVGGKPTSEDLASHREARPWKEESNLRL